jgi:large subunit ribosomal protein L17
MRKRYSRVRVNVKRSHSVSMLRSLLLSLLLNGSITTTESRAKMLKRYADSEIAYATRSRLSDSDRQIAAHVGNMILARRMYLLREFVLEKHTDHAGSFVKTINAGHRSGDNARTIEVQFLMKDEFLAFIESKKPRKPKKQKVKKVQARKPQQKGVKESQTGKGAKIDEVPKKVSTEDKKADLKKPKDKPPQAPQPPVVRREGFFARLGGRILGRRVQGPSGQQGRSTARSGI